MLFDLRGCRHFWRWSCSQKLCVFGELGLLIGFLTNLRALLVLTIIACYRIYRSHSCTATSLTNNFD